MNRLAGASQFYGLQILDYNIKPLRDQNLFAKDNSNITIDNAHIYAFALQQGYNVPSQSRIVKTVNKNRSEHTVYKLDRMSKNYSSNPYQYIFRKQKKFNPIRPKVAKVNKKEAFQVQSPEQIAIKCARQAFVRQILKNEVKILKKEVKVPSQQEQKRRQHQKQRRLQRMLILKAYKNELFQIFGQIIFQKGWKISREQLKESLQLPSESFNIQLMQGILKARYAKAVLDRELFLLKKKNYQKERYERLKMQRYMNRFEKRTYVPHSKIIYPHKQVQIYDEKRSHELKSKSSKIEGERIKKLRRRKMRKQKVWYKQNNQPNGKQIKKQADESTIDLEAVEEEEDQFVQQPQDLNFAENGSKQNEIVQH